MLAERRALARPYRCWILQRADLRSSSGILVADGKSDRQGRERTLHSLCAVRSCLEPAPRCPKVPLRQWVLTLPYAIRYRLAYNAKLLGAVTRAFLSAVLAFYKRRFGASGCIAVVQRTSSDLKCNPHVHAVFLDGGYVNGLDGEPVFQPLAHLRGRDLADVLVRARKRIERVLARANDPEPDDDVRPMLTSVTGQPPAGPAFKRGARADLLEARAVCAPRRLRLARRDTRGCRGRRRSRSATSICAASADCPRASRPGS